ncbi:hypothetical protein Bhyg_16552 [Pseudolycoriella hygida]|uniref:Terpene synthase n=1 Tax=Pseudolycoriella hygida TaxID=35572 RepID=A0A9Q0MLY9_9DIPT|nr:hypothetical protein Bhyg_16552 [Pseudolycoriella hygida]
MNCNKQKKKLEFDHRISDLTNVHLRGIKAPSVKFHPNWESLFQFIQQEIAEELGPNLELSKGISNFLFYVFPSLTYDIASSVLIYNMALFMLDEHLKEFPGEAKNMIQKIRNKSFTGNKNYDKLWRLSIKVCTEVMGENTFDQLLECLIHTWTKALEVHKLICSEVTLSDSKFIELRRVGSSVSHLFFLVLIGAKMQFATGLQSDPNYLGLNKHAAIHVTLVNDLYSLRKQIRDGSVKRNYVYVKMNNGNITAQQSVDEIIHEIDEADIMAHQHGENLKKTNDPNLCRYVDGIYDAMKGNHYWSTIG